MSSDSLIMNYLYKPEQIRKIEDIISEFRTHRDSINECAESKYISDKYYANQILRSIFPKITEFLGYTDAKKPKAVLHTESIMGSLGSFLLHDYFPRFSKSISEQRFDFSEFNPFHPVFMAERMATSVGAVNPDWPIVVHVKTQKADSFTYTLAHEITHSVHHQSRIKKKISYDAFETGFFSEGLSELCAHETSKNQSLELAKFSNNRALVHLKRTYELLCKDNFVPRKLIMHDIPDANPASIVYDQGFCAMLLLYREKGIEIIKELMENKITSEL